LKHSSTHQISGSKVPAPKLLRRPYCVDSQQVPGGWQLGSQHCPLRLS